MNLESILNLTSLWYAVLSDSGCFIACGSLRVLLSFSSVSFVDTVGLHEEGAGALPSSSCGSMILQIFTLFYLVCPENCTQEGLGCGRDCVGGPLSWIDVCHILDSRLLSFHSLLVLSHHIRKRDSSHEGIPESQERSFCQGFREQVRYLVFCRNCHQLRFSSK